MVRPREFGFLVIILCLVVCFCASATVSKEDATKAVKDAQKSTQKVYNAAKTHLGYASSLLSEVEVLKGRANRAASKAEEAAKDNQEFLAIAEKARKAQETVMILYANAKVTVQEAVTCMKELLSEAETLEGKSNIKIEPNEGSRRDYTNTKNKATDLVTEANELNEKLTEAVQLVAAAFSMKRKVEKHAEEAQLVRHHVDTFVAVAKIQTMLNYAGIIIRKAEHKMDEVNDTVEEMKMLCRNIPPELISYIKALCTKAESDLSYALKAVDKAKEAKEAILSLKVFADGALEKVKDEIDISEAASEVGRANWFVENAATEASPIVSALRTAEIAAKSAESKKEDLLRALSKNDRLPVLNTIE